MVLERDFMMRWSSWYEKGPRLWHSTIVLGFLRVEWTRRHARTRSSGVGASATHDAAGAFEFARLPRGTAGTRARAPRRHFMQKLTGAVGVATVNTGARRHKLVAFGFAPVPAVAISAAQGYSGSLYGLTGHRSRSPGPRCLGARPAWRPRRCRTAPRRGPR